MKKKKNVSFVLVSIIFLAAAIIVSCSSEFKNEMIDYTSIQQKERIEEMAKEYGLSVVVRDDIFATRAGNDQDIENEFAMMSSFLGDYEIFGEQNGDSIILYGLGNNMFSISSIPPYNETTGNVNLTTTEFVHASDCGIVINYCFEISVSLHWDFTNHNFADITGATITEFNCGVTFIPTISNKHVYVVGSLPTIVFTCDLNMTGFCGTYYYSVSGDYCITTGVGSLHII
ncbi:MAG: hypothetical protein IKP91_01350 [Bacteroidaceae bacterium]|nr:hypothetical protein [Bacteroidaceae bacterium]